MASVYWIRLPEHHNIFTQGYIGISNNTQTRFSDHKSCRAKTHLSRAIKKYGWDNLVKEVILIADRVYCLMIESKLRPDIRLGWNTLPGGGITPDNKGKTAWNKGKKLTAKQKANMFDIVEYMKSKTHGMLGRKHTKESIEKMKKSKKGTIISEETKQKMSRANKGKVYNKVLCSNCNQMIGYNVHQAFHGDKCKGYRPFIARTTMEGKRIYLGKFATKELADQAIQQYKENKHG